MGESTLRRNAAANLNMIGAEIQLTGGWERTGSVGNNRSQFENNNLLDGVAMLLADLPPANSTTMHSRLVCQDRNLCFDWNIIFARSDKTAVTFESIK